MEAGKMVHRKFAYCSIRLPIMSAAFASALLVTLSAANPQAVNATVEHERGPGNFADLAEKVGPAVIGVGAKVAVDEESGQSSGPDESPDEDMPRGAIPKSEPRGPGSMPKIGGMTSIGSGFFVSSDGYAVTNNHIVAGSDTAEIRTSEDKVYPAKIVAKDPLSDLALLKVDGRTDLAYLKLADQPPRAGDWVLTVGNTFGLGNTVTAGIVSARSRDLGTGSSDDLVQIDAPINRGDSGGPSLNTRGDVIGVNSMILSPSGGSVGVAFAIPADTVKAVIPQLKDKGAVTRGWMGAEVQSVTPEIAESIGANNLRGAIVVGVQASGPAAQAGLKGGDVITSVGGEPVKSANEVTKKVHAAAPGSSIELSVVRNDKPNSLTVTLGQLTGQSSAPARMPR
jgi:serine protease Do